MGVENISGHPSYSYKGTIESQRNGGGGGGDNMEARIAKLESDVKHIDGNLVRMWDDLRELRTDIKTDFRILWGALFVATIGLAGLLAKGFEWI